MLALLVVSSALAEEAAPLPDPLTLGDALALARADLPSVELAAAGRDASAAALAEAESITGVRLDLVGRLRAIDPSSLAPNRDPNDSSARVALSKRLYDFGYSDARRTAAEQAGSGSEWRHLDARQQARLDIMRSFFDVLVADLRYARDNEAMAGAYIDADRARDRHELKRLSDVELLRFEADYQTALHQRMLSQAQQRATRARLALAMGRPGELVSNLVRPAGPDVAAESPEYEALLAEVMQGNPVLQALRSEVEGARAAVDAARKDYGPVLSGELDAQTYNRKTNTTHPFGAALVLEVPLLSGGARDAAIAAAQAGLRSKSATLAATEHALREEVLDLWLRLDTLRLQIAGLKVRGDYRELYLDRSRALYELEVKTDLGDAMTEVSAWRLDTAEAEFDWIMTRARLDALAGRLLAEEQTP